MSKDMDFAQLAANLSPDVYQRMKTAVEIGRWADGRPLSQAQRDITLQAIMHYENENLPAQQRSGYIEPRKSGACLSDHEHRQTDEQTLRWQD